MPLDDQLREERDGAALHVQLPARRMGCLNAGAIILIVMSTVALFICYQFSYESLRDFFNNDDPQDHGKYFELVFGIVGLIPGIVGLGLGLLGVSVIVFKSHVRITVDAEWIKARERLGPFFKTWSMRRVNLESFQIQSAVTSTDRKTNKTTSTHYGIMAKGKAGTEMRLAPGYPIELLERVVAILAAETNTTAEQALIESEQVSVEKPINPTNIPLPEQPLGSKIEWEDRADGLAMRIPPVGLKKGSKGLWVFAVFWNAIVGLIYVGLAYAAIVNKDDEAWTGMLAMLIFLAVGVGTGLAALNMGKRKADILLMRSVLTIKRSGIFGEKVKEFDIVDLQSISTGPSGMEVNDRPVYELQVFDKDSKKLIGLLSQLDDKELEWIAALLDRKLKIFN